MNLWNIDYDDDPDYDGDWLTPEEKREATKAEQELDVKLPKPPKRP